MPFTDRFSEAKIFITSKGSRIPGFQGHVSAISSLHDDIYLLGSLQWAYFQGFTPQNSWQNSRAARKKRHIKPLKIRPHATKLLDIVLRRSAGAGEPALCTPVMTTNMIISLAEGRPSFCALYEIQGTRGFRRPLVDGKRVYS